MMRSKALYGFGNLLVLMALLLCSCGVNQQETKRQTANPNVASGSALTEGEMEVAPLFKNSETTVKKERFANDTFRVWVDYNRASCPTMQENLDGTGRKELDKDIDIFWLTNDWAYCIGLKESPDWHSAIYRVPIDAATGEIDIGNKEILFNKSDVGETFSSYTAGDCMVTDTCLFFIEHGMSNGERCFRYDFDTKEVSQVCESVSGKNRDLSILCDEMTEMPIVTDHYFFLIDDDGCALYRVDIENFETIKIDMDCDIDSLTLAVAGDGKNLYLAPEEGGNIFRYSPDGEKAELIYSEKQFTSMIADRKLGDEDTLHVDAYIDKLSAWNDRLYMIAYLEWDSEETLAEGSDKGEPIEIQFTREVVLSADLNDLSQWTLEKRLSDYIIENAIPDIYVFEDIAEDPVRIERKHTVDTLSSFAGIGQGQIYFQCCTDRKDLGSDKYDLFVYYIDSGQIEKIKHSDYRFYLMVS